MKKLRYFFGTMASAKSSNLLMKVYQFEESGAKCLLLKPSQDNRVEGEIYSRIIPSRKCKIVHPSDDICKIVYNSEDFELGDKYDYIFIDEVQFLTREHIKQLWTLVHKYDVDVFCYGLKLDYKNRLFPASEELLILADSVEEIKSKCRFCSRKASTHLKEVNGEIQKSGETIYIDNILPEEGLTVNYYLVCQNCWHEA